MASSHPVVSSYFNASNSASWFSTAFLLTSSAFQPLLGRLSDALGRKPLFVGAMGIFAASITWSSLAGSIESFIISRAFCGIGAGGVMTLGSIIVSDLVPIENRGAYQSYINMNYGVGSSLGAATGGYIADSLGWRWEFGIQVPPLLICMVVAWIAIPDDLGIQGQRKSVWQALKEFDFRGSLLLTTAITSVILGLVGSPVTRKKSIVLTCPPWYRLLEAMLCHVSQPTFAMNLEYELTARRVTSSCHRESRVLRCYFPLIPLG